MDEPDPADLEDLEELVRDLAALCGALRAFSRHGSRADLSLADMESLAAVAAHLAERLVERYVLDGGEVRWLRERGGCSAPNGG